MHRAPGVIPAIGGNGLIRETATELRELQYEIEAGAGFLIGRK